MMSSVKQPGLSFPGAEFPYVTNVSQKKVGHTTLKQTAITDSMFLNAWLQTDLL
jgi:hypothetical protein